MQNDAFSLEQRVALVTGSTTGIGRAIAEAFTNSGARVAINGRDRDKVSAIAGELAGAIEAPFDVTDHEAAEKAVDDVIKQAGRLDIVVCNAGARDRRKFAEIDPDSYRRILEANSISAYQLSRLAMNRITHPQNGRIIFISSAAARRPLNGETAYASTKAAMESLARSLAFIVGPQGTTANVISPGFVATEFNQSMVEDEKVTAFVESRIPAKRWAQPHEVANVAVFLASDAASYVNGHVLMVDAGMTAIL